MLFSEMFFMEKFLIALNRSHSDVNFAFIIFITTYFAILKAFSEGVFLFLIYIFDTTIQKIKIHLNVFWKSRSLIKKGFKFRKTGFVFEKSDEKSLFKKKVLRNKKPGIVNSKIDKNRIYWRKKGDDKNRKKKDFFPPR